MTRTVPTRSCSTSAIPADHSSLTQDDVSSTGSGRGAEDVLALGGVEATPDSIGLADVESVAQALREDGTAGARILRDGFASAAARAAFVLGGEERLWVDVAQLQMQRPAEIGMTR